MSIYNKTLQGRHGVLATALISCSLVAALSTSSSAQSVLSVAKPVSGAVGVVSTRMISISGHVPDMTKQSAMLGALPASQRLSFSIALPFRNQAALADLMKGLNDPSDARYGQYLTPAQFGAQFGPSQTEYDTLISYLQSKGLTVSQTFPARTYLSLSGTTAQVNAAFGVAIKQFRSPEGRVFHSPSAEVTVPSTIAGLITGVVGLDDANIPKPLMHMVRPVAAPTESIKAIMPAYADPESGMASPSVQGTGPGGGYSPSDLRTAYGLDGTALKGTGQTIAMIEFGTNYNIKDALKYERQFGLPQTPIATVQVETVPVTTFTGAATETMLDIDMQIALAPLAKQILVFLEPNGGFPTTDAINAVYTDGRAKQLSISYGFGAEGTGKNPTANQNSLEQAYLQLATAGVSVYVSSGDGGSAPNGSSVTIDTSSDEPSVCSVGGTTLNVQVPGSNEAYKSESTWNDGPGDAGGGGVSKQWTIQPRSSVTTSYDGATYQANAAKFSSAITGSNVSSVMRNVPDISCNADPNTGVAIYSSVDPTLAPGWYVFGGTSEAAPLWAGYTALINQNRALAGLGTLGLPNNSLYPLAYTANGLTSNYTTLFHDIADGSNNSTLTGGTIYKAVTGFDASTGLGTMQGPALIAALSGGVLYAGLPSGNGPTHAQAHYATVRLASFGLPLPSKSSANTL